MTSIPQAVTRFSEFQSLFPQAPFTTGTDQFQARIQANTHTNFSFITAEGDRISLSTHSAVQTSFGTYTYQGHLEGQSVSLQRRPFSASASTAFNLLIEEDLNEQEQADIQRFLKSA